MKQEQIQTGLAAAMPVCVGYVALGVACGIVGEKAGMSVWQILLLSVLLYAGSGQFMVASMFAGGATPIAIAASVALVNMRHILYGSALARFFQGEPKGRTALFAAQITDEAFGVNMSRFQQGGWSPAQARVVNFASHGTWILSNVIGALLSELIALDTAIIGFSMTAIFICLLLMQKRTADHLAAMAVAAAGVVVCKCVGWGQVAVLIGAVLGVAAGIAVAAVRGEGEENA